MLVTTLACSMCLGLRFFASKLSLPLLTTVLIEIVSDVESIDSLFKFSVKLLTGLLSSVPEELLVMFFVVTHELFVSEPFLFVVQNLVLALERALNILGVYINIRKLYFKKENRQRGKV